MLTNISNRSQLPEEKIATLLALIGQPARIQILYALGEQETCVCHLVAVLDMRQASISQHLMALRKAGLVTARRAGRNMFYQVTEPGVLDVLCQAADLCHLSAAALMTLAERPVAHCPCPQCSGLPSCHAETRDSNPCNPN